MYIVQFIYCNVQCTVQYSTVQYSTVSKGQIPIYILTFICDSTHCKFETAAHTVNLRQLQTFQMKLLQFCFWFSKLICCKILLVLEGQCQLRAAVIKYFPFM